MDELKYMINYYLMPEHEEERLRIVKAGRELILNTYTYDHFVKNLISFK